MLGFLGIRDSVVFFRGAKTRHGVAEGPRRDVDVAWEVKAIMENQNRVDPNVLQDLEFTGVNLERRTRMMKMALELVRQGLARGEIKDALDEFSDKMEWELVSPNDTYWITHLALQKIRQAEYDNSQASLPVPQPDELIVVRLDEVTPEPVRWLWAGKIPLGRVTAIYGELGLGKTRVGLDLAARVSAGKVWPDGAASSGAAQVLMVNGVDPLKTSVSPRLLGSGANPQNVSTVVEALSGGVKRRVDLGRDIPLLRKRIEQLGQVRLVVIDWLEVCCGKGHVSKARLQSILLDLEQLAAECGVAVVVVSAANTPDLPVKNIWRVDSDMLHPDQLCWMPVRFYEGPLPGAIPFRITEKGIDWGDPEDAPSPDRLQGTTPKQQRSRQLRAQMDWLRRKLLDGPQPAKDMFAGGKAAGWSASQVKRAKQALNVLCYKEEKPKGRWIWELPFENWTGPVVGKTHVFGAIPPELDDGAEWFRQKQKELRDLGIDV